MSNTNKTESGWLIECGFVVNVKTNSPTYIAVVNDDMGITVNAFEALRFSRMVDAQNIVKALGFVGVSCTFHEFES
jgi:hypothetical protein